MSSKPPNGQPSNTHDTPSIPRVEQWLTPEVMTRALARAAAHAERMRVIFDEGESLPSRIEHPRQVADQPRSEEAP